MNANTLTPTYVANKVEAAFDILGYVPFVSKFSGALRMTIAKVMLVVGALCWGWAFLSLKCLKRFPQSGNDQSLQPYNPLLLKIHTFGGMLMMNGLANYVRGFGESLGLLGNAGALAWDYFSDKYGKAKFVDYSYPQDSITAPVFTQGLVNQGVRFARNTVDSFNNRGASSSRGDEVHQ